MSMKTLKTLCCGFLATTVLATMACKTDSRPSLKSAELFSIQDDRCKSTMTLKDGTLSVAQDGALDAVARFPKLKNGNELVLNEETEFLNLKTQKTGKVMLVSTSMLHVAQALHHHERFSAAIEDSDAEALFLVEARAANAAASCVLFPYSTPVKVNEDELLLGQCPGALLFEGQERCEGALRLLKDAADAEMRRISAQD